MGRRHRGTAPILTCARARATAYPVAPRPFRRRAGRLVVVAGLRRRRRRAARLLVPGAVVGGGRPRPGRRARAGDERRAAARRRRPVHALPDRCPHRGVPLSLGKEEFPGTVTCPYHGWTYRLDGRRAGRGHHRRPRLADLRQGQRRDLPDRRAPRARVGVHRRSRAAPADRPAARGARRRAAACASAAGSRTATATGGCSPRTASTRATPSTSTARRTGACSRSCRRGTRSTSSGTAAGSTASRTSATGTPTSRGSATGPTSAGGRRKPKQAQGKMLGNTGGAKQQRPVHRSRRTSPASPRSSLPGVLRIAYPQFIHYEFYVPIEAGRTRYVGVMVQFKTGLEPGRVLRQVPRRDPLAVPRQLLGPGPLDGVDRRTRRPSGCTAPTSRCSSGAASSRRATRSSRRPAPRSDDGSRRRGMSRHASLVAPPIRPDGRHRAARARTTYHVTTLGAGPARRCSSTVAAPAAPAGPTSGRSRTASPPTGSVTSSTCCSTGSPSKPTISGPDVGLPRRRRWSSCSTRSRSSAPTSCATRGAARSRSTSPADYPDRARSLVVTGSMPVFYGRSRRLPEGGRRGRNARDRYYGGEGPTWEKMRAAHGSPRVVRRHADPDETVTMRYEQSLDPEEMRARRLAPTTRAASGRTSSEHLRGDPVPGPVLLGHARRLPHTRLPADARPHGAARAAVRDGRRVAPPAGGAPGRLPPRRQQRSWTWSSR